MFAIVGYSKQGESGFIGVGQTPGGAKRSAMKFAGLRRVYSTRQHLMEKVGELWIEREPFKPSRSRKAAPR